MTLAFVENVGDKFTALGITHFDRFWSVLCTQVGLTGGPRPGREIGCVILDRSSVRQSQHSFSTILVGELSKRRSHCSVDYISD